MKNSLYRHLEEKGLSIDQKLIIMAEAKKYCQDNHVEFVRYLHLKKLSDDKLAYVTNGERTDLGGNFDNMIRKLSDPTIPGKERYFKYPRETLGFTQIFH